MVRLELDAAKVAFAPLGPVAARAVGFAFLEVALSLGDGDKEVLRFGT